MDRRRILSGQRAAVCLVAGAALLLTSVAMTACSSKEDTSGEPRIDMTSDETAARSIERVRESLDESQRRELADATVVLVRHTLGVDRSAALDPEKSKEAVRKVLNGKTAQEVIAEARKVEAESPVPLSDRAAQKAPPAAGAAAGAGAGAGTGAAGAAAGGGAGTH